MREIRIAENQSGQRLDKILKKYLNQASSGFIYKMLRKKNIKLNGKRAGGSEKLSEGDRIEMYFSEDTFHKLMQEERPILQDFSHIHVVYEDDNLLILNKPAGILSQKAKEKDVSLNDEILAYLQSKKEISNDSLRIYRPSLCNRLDRNTSGIVLAGKTLPAAQELNRIIRDRSLKKYYKCLVAGKITEEKQIHGFLLKDKKTNTVRIYQTPVAGASEIATIYRPLGYYGKNTLLEVELVTGKTHQIRAHLSSIGHPIMGDRKYGDFEKYRKEAEAGSFQALFAWKIVFPEKMNDALKYMSGRTFTVKNPSSFEKILRRFA